MSKVAGILLAVVFASVMLTGCMTKSCDQAPMTYKDGK
jgi:hypothetical protein